jgi:hypothetical protein
VQGTTEFHHQIADARLPQADPVFHEAIALDTAVDMLDPEPTWCSDVGPQRWHPLAQHWGGGTLSPSDGQRFPVRGKVRNARTLPRYFGYGEGITVYSWSSEQCSQYGTKVISSTSRDATYVLDEILNNKTDLTTVEHTTDTAGYTDLVFCLFDLRSYWIPGSFAVLGRQP